MSNKRASAPQNMSPNAFDVQRDRLQLMREAEDLERNFPPAAFLNRKYAQYVAPISYHAMTGDHALDSEVEEYLNHEVFPNCDHTGRYDFFRMMGFGVMGANRGGDYGFAFTRPGINSEMSEDEILEFDLRIQAIEPDRIGGVYQNTVSNTYVAGLNIGPNGEIVSFKIFHRSMTTNCYDDPVDVPAKDFVHLTDPLRIDMYRSVTRLAPAIKDLRDLYESMEYVMGKMKLASAMTVFTNSNGATAGGGAYDPYKTDISSGATAFQQDIAFGQINHLSGGTDIKFPASASPSEQEQWLIVQKLKFVAMAYGLPYSFAFDAGALGGVSARLESELAKDEFERGQREIITPAATRIKNTFLTDACAKGIWPVSKLQQICRGRWGFRPHPQPDLGKEATAAVTLYQQGLLDPIQYWTENGGNPEGVADNMVRWAKIKRDKAAEAGMEVADVFGNGPTMPLSVSESTTDSTTEDAATNRGKKFASHQYLESDSSINDKITKERGNVDFAEGWIDDVRADIADAEKSGDAEGLQKSRIELDKANAYLSEHKAALEALQGRRDRRDTAKPQRAQPTREEREKKAKLRDDRHVLVQALIASGRPEKEAYAISYKVTQDGKFDKGRLPADIREKYYSRHHYINFDESKHPRADNGEFGSGGGSSSGRSERAKVGNLEHAERIGEGKDSRLVINGRPAPDFIKPGMIPPAYSNNIRIATDPKSDVWAKCEDKDGNPKTVYNPEFLRRNETIKWGRTNEGVGKIDSIRSQIHNDRNQGKNKEEADASWLMSQQATRPGSDEDTKGSKALWSKPVSASDFVLTPDPKGKGPAKVSIKIGESDIPIRDEKARAEIESRISNGKPMGDAGYWLKSHGATTLEGRHVVENPDGSASLQFMGKEGVWHDHKVSDTNLSKMLLDRKAAAGDTGKLFNTDYGKVSKYVGGLGGGGFSPKDMRTIRANEIASRELGEKPIEVGSESERNAIIKGIAEKVSGVLGNRPQQALSSYINPMIFNAIKVRKTA